MKPKYTLDVKPWGDEYRVLLSIGVQSFYVGGDFETRKEAVWYRTQLRKALDIISINGGEEE